MKITFFTILLLWVIVSYGQKPTLKLDTYKSWPDVGGGGLSTDGQYAFYVARNYPAGKNTFYLKTTGGKELFALEGLRSPNFSVDNRYLYGTLPGDSVLIFDIKRKEMTFLGHVSSYELFQMKSVQYLLLRSGATLKLCTQTGKQIHTYANTIRYKVSPDGNSVFLIRQDSIEGNKVTAWWVDITSGKTQQVYRGPAADKVIFDRQGLQVAFLAGNEGRNQIYYYKKGNNAAVALSSSDSFGGSNELTIESGDYWNFSKDGQRIFFSLQDIEKTSSESNDVEISSYEDAYLKSYYNGRGGNSLKRRRYLCTVTISDGKVMQLISGNQRLLGTTLKYDTDSVFIVESANGLMTEPWNTNSAAAYFLCKSTTGKMVPIEAGLVNRILNFDLSPAGKYFVYFNPVKHAYFSYNIATNEKIKIGSDITGNLGKAYREHYPRPWDSVPNIGGWADRDTAVLIQTAYDIWRVDPKGIAAAVNLTQGKGESEGIVFNVLNVWAVGKRRKILLSAFNIRHKDFGFYEADLENNGGIKILSMDKRYIGTIRDLYTQLYKPDFISSAGGYLVRWQKAEQFPNYFYSKDLKSFQQLSDFQPQKKYNWLTSELCEYQDSSGAKYQGVLYKPDDFDPLKRYPVIFNIYETQSNSLNAFDVPMPSGVNIDPAVLASNGYLVFLPDVRGKAGNPGEGALNSIIAAADHLKKQRWVDAKKMGLMGHSFGGFEVNYIISHSNLFAAAIPSAGVSLMVNDAIAQWSSEENKQYFVQFEEPMMNRPIADDPTAYVNNSPLLYAKSVSTPILFMHNDGDENVDYKQTEAFFTVLRAMKKPVWWLNYKGQGHGVSDRGKQLDYNTKVWQFLDHYLKGAPMPDWMKEHL